jgi:hypothetical protein
MSTENLWPADLADKRVTTPKEILVAQEVHFNRMMNNVLVATVDSYGGPNEGEFIHRLIISAPSLGNYSLTLLRCTHTLKLYPVKVINQVESMQFMPKDEHDLKLVLGQIFSSEVVQRSIVALKSQII